MRKRRSFWQKSKRHKTLRYIGHQRISQTVESETKNVTHFFTLDGHGSTRILLNAAYAVVQVYSFDAYGNALGFNASEALTEFLYSGEQFDSKIGQQYLRARYYDSATGRFNRLDPFFGNLNDPQSLHKYAYTHGDPVNNYDPTGMFSVGGLGIGLSIGLGAISAGGIASASLYGNYKSDGSWLGNAKEMSGMIGKGVLQGWANTLNGLLDIFSGFYNLAAFGLNLQVRGLSFGFVDPMIPYIQEEDWDWSKDLFFPESDSAHGWSKWFGGNGLMPALTASGVHMWNVAKLPTMKVAIGEGRPFHVAYEAKGTWMHASGQQLGNLRLHVFRAYHELVCSRAFFPYPACLK